MTNQPAAPVDAFAGGESVPSISFNNAPIGAAYTGTVTQAPTFVQSRDFKTGDPKVWPDGNPQMAVVTHMVLSTGEERSIWAAKPSSMFAAFKAAQDAAGSLIAVGGHLVITLTGLVPAKANNLSPQKLYAVTYKAPDAFAAPPVVKADPWAAPPAAAPPAFAQPAPPAPPVAPPAVAAGPTAEQIAAYLASQPPVTPAPAAPVGYTPEQRAAAEAAGITLPGV